MIASAFAVGKASFICVQKKEKRNYFRLEETKEGLRFNNAERKEKEQAENERARELAIQRPASR